MTAAAVTHPKRTGRGWAYIGVILGGLVSVAANVAHSFVPPADVLTGWQPPAGAVIGAVFWPVFLFVALEILARTHWPTGPGWLALRFGGLLPVALVAGVVSYRHLSGLLTYYHEDTLTAAIGPLAVDGLMVVATGALIATGTRRSTTDINAGPDLIPAQTTVDTHTGVPVESVPTHLLPTARFSVVNHHQSTGQAITADQLATRMNVPVDTAHRLLAALGEDTIPTGTPTPVNGTALVEVRR